MTRETKIGLVVGFSFLCLVGIVVASKWRTGDDQFPEEQGDRTPEVKLAQHDPKGKDGAKKNDKPVVVTPVVPKKLDADKITLKPIDIVPVPVPAGFGTSNSQEKIQQLQA